MSTASILHLDDYVLLQIFRYLPIVETCYVANACVRFQAIAEDIFKRIHTIDYIDDFVANRNVGHFDFQIIGKCVGKYVTAIYLNLAKFIDFNPSEFQNNEYHLNHFRDFGHLLTLIPKYFPMLTILKIGHMKSGFYCPPLPPVGLLQSINRQLYICRINVLPHEVELIRKYWPFHEIHINLDTLMIFDSSFLSNITGIHGLALEKIESETTSIEMSFPRFCANNNETLKRLQIVDCDFLECSIDVFCQGLMKLKNLDELSLVFDDQGYEHVVDGVAEMTKLKNLHLKYVINCAWIIAKLAKQDTLQYLAVESCLFDCDESMARKLKFTQLKTLNLTNTTINSRTLLSLARHNRLLNKLQLTYAEGTDDAIVSLVNELKSLKVLDIKYYVNDKICLKLVEDICTVLVKDEKENRPLLTLSLDRWEAVMAGNIDVSIKNVAGKYAKQICVKLSWF